MHFRRNRTRVRATGAILGPQPRLRKPLRGIFDNGERIPDRDVAIDQRWDLARTGETQDLSLVGLAGIERDEDFLEGNMIGAQRQPGPHRPRRIILVADDKLQRHATKSLVLPHHATAWRMRSTSR